MMFRPEELFDCLLRPAVENPQVTRIEFVLNEGERANWRDHIVPKLAACHGREKAIEPRWCTLHERVSFVFADRDAEVTGNPDPKRVSTRCVERSNLTMRMSMRRFTRLTNGFSTKIENHAAMVSLYCLYYNLALVYQTLCVTPAMEAGLADHVCAIEEIVALLWYARALAHAR